MTSESCNAIIWARTARTLPVTLYKNCTHVTSRSVWELHTRDQSRCMRTAHTLPVALSVQSQNCTHVTSRSVCSVWELHTRNHSRCLCSLGTLQSRCYQSRCRGTLQWIRNDIMFQLMKPFMSWIRLWICVLSVTLLKVLRR